MRHSGFALTFPEEECFQLKSFISILRSPGQQRRISEWSRVGSRPSMDSEVPPRGVLPSPRVPAAEAYNWYRYSEDWARGYLLFLKRPSVWRAALRARR